MNKEQEQVLSHVKYMQSLTNDDVLAKAIKLIESLAEENQQLRGRNKTEEDKFEGWKTSPIFE